MQVGSVPHPMEEKHWIEWIELVPTTGSIARTAPGQAPAALCIDAAAVKARAYCNLHGLWQG